MFFYVCVQQLLILDFNTNLILFQGNGFLHCKYINFYFKVSIVFSFSFINSVDLVVINNSC